MCNFDTQFHPGLMAIAADYISAENSMAISSKGPGLTESTAASGAVRGRSNSPWFEPILLIGTGKDLSGLSLL